MRSPTLYVFGICTYCIQIMKAKVDIALKWRYVARFLMTSALSGLSRLHEASLAVTG